jgi:hypothetical protein
MMELPGFCCVIWRQFNLCDLCVASSLDLVGLNPESNVAATFRCVLDNIFASLPMCPTFCSGDDFKVSMAGNSNHRNPRCQNILHRDGLVVM